MNHSEGTATTEQIQLERRLPSYWRVTSNMPPLNIFGPKEIPQLNEITTAIETDQHVKVIVFDNAPMACSSHITIFSHRSKTRHASLRDGPVSRHDQTCWHAVSPGQRERRRREIAQLSLGRTTQASRKDETAPELRGC
jgi:enoyl-CoA hydratase/carnithine racemase